MLSFLVTSFYAYVMYLLLTAGSGDIFRFWSHQELFTGIFLSAIVGLATRNFLCHTECKSCRMVALNPLRWLIAIVYVVGPFFLEMAKANVDVAIRVITGHIRPGIVRVKSGMQTDLGALMLANSITLTPGTLTVDIEDDTHDLFVHMIHISEGEEDRESLEAKEIFALFDCPKWIRRITE